MQLKLAIDFEEEELDKVNRVVSAIRSEVDIPVEKLELSQTEQAVLQAVRDDPGRAARKVHQKASEYDWSPIQWVDGNGPERTEVKQTLHTLRGTHDLVRLNQRSWYPK